MLVYAIVSPSMNSTSPPCVFDHPQPGAAREGVGIAQTSAFDAKAFELAVTALLRACGISPDSPHTSKTAQRVRELWEKRLLGGYEIEPGEALGEGFEDARQDMVLIRGIAIHGVCPHHLVPFRGIAHVAYIPGGRLHGFGRIARMVDAIGHRFTYQEWMTRDIAEATFQRGLDHVGTRTKRRCGMGEKTANRRVVSVAKRKRDLHVPHPGVPVGQQRHGNVGHQAGHDAESERHVDRKRERKLHRVGQRTTVRERQLSPPRETEHAERRW